MIDRARLENEGTMLLTDLRIDRENLFAGLLQGIEGMRGGGIRKLKNRHTSRMANMAFALVGYRQWSSSPKSNLLNNELS